LGLTQAQVAATLSGSAITALMRGAPTTLVVIRFPPMLARAYRRIRGALKRAL
jgi:hypothetical protein